MNLLALDLGTKTGWALDAQGVKESGTQDFSLRRGDSPGMRFVMFQRWLKRLCLGDRPTDTGKLVDMIVFERAHHRGGAATEVSVGFQSHVLSFCARYHIEHAAVHSGTLKKFVTGKGNASKYEMIDAVHRRFQGHLCGPEACLVVLDDNEADAIALLEFARAELIGTTGEAINA